MRVYVYVYVYVCVSVCVCVCECRTLSAPRAQRWQGGVDWLGSDKDPVPTVSHAFVIACKLAAFRAQFYV
jgi:hypothetical protein